MDMFPKLLGLVVICLLLVVLVIVMRILAADARRRGKPPLLVVLLALVSFPLGLLLWLVFRPEPLHSNVRPFRLGDHRIQ
jgi:hypothetical protein